MLVCPYKCQRAAYSWRELLPHARLQASGSEARVVLLRAGRVIAVCITVASALSTDIVVRYQLQLTELGTTHTNPSVARPAASWIMALMGSADGDSGQF